MEFCAFITKTFILKESAKHEEKPSFFLKTWFLLHDSLHEPTKKGGIKPNITVFETIFSG